MRSQPIRRMATDAGNWLRDVSSAHHRISVEPQLDQLDPDPDPRFVNHIQQQEFQDAKTPNIRSVHSLLTDLDVILLTLIAIALSIMSIIVVAICLFKYKMDRIDRERILAKFMMQNQLLEEPDGLQILTGALKKSHRNKPPKCPKKSPIKKQVPNKPIKTSIAKRLEAHQLVSNITRASSKQLLLPPRPHSMLPGGQNFLMRSPTIRRVQGLANHAGNWLRLASRSHPPMYPRRNRLFLGAPGLCQSGSQLTTAKLITSSNQLNRSAQPLIPAAWAGGCPLHAFKYLQASRSKGDCSGRLKRCRFCTRLKNSIERTKVNYMKDIVRQAEYVSSASSLIEDTTTAHINKSTQTQAPILEQLGKRAETRPDTDADALNRDGHKMKSSSRRLRALIEQLEARGRKTSVEQMSPKLDKNLAGSTSYWRDTRAKPLKTFGSTAASRSGQPTADSDHVTNNATANESQIPTLDVEGRFAYREGSQINSPHPYAFESVLFSGDEEAQGNSNSNNNNNNRYDERDVFVLVVHEDSTNGKYTHMSNQERIEILRLRAHNNRPISISETTQDECSRSSSPVAYGFMRSSPSVTTISSVTHCQKRLTWKSPKFARDDNNNNIDVSYSLPDEDHYQRINKHVSLDLGASYRSNTSGEQTFVSRL